MSTSALGTHTHQHTLMEGLDSGSNIRVQEPEGAGDCRAGFPCCLLQPDSLVWLGVRAARTKKKKPKTRHLVANPACGNLRYSQDFRTEILLLLFMYHLEMIF